MSYSNAFGILFVIAFFAESIAAQLVDVDKTDSNWIRYTQLSARSKTIYDDDRYQGDVYLFEDWKTAEFILPDENTVVVDSVKLNLLRGQVEITFGGKQLGIRGSQFNSFRFLDNMEESAVFKSKHFYFNDGERLPGIIKTISVGDYDVLVSYKPEIRQLSKENPLMLEKLNKDKVRITKLKFIEKGGELIRIKNKKDLYRYFSSDKKVKEFISENKLSHKNEDDIAKVVDFATSNG